MTEGINVWKSVSITDVDQGPIVGIDFGTSNSAIAVWHYAKNRVKVIRNVVTNQRTTPSTILFDQNEVKIGIAAEDTPLHVIEGCKLFLGRERNDGDMELESHLGYQFNNIDDKICVCDVNSSRSMSVEEAAARIMSELKASAEIYLQRRPKAWLGSEHDLLRKGTKAWDGVLRRVVVGIPANHTERKKEATRRAALLAGFTEVHLMVESSAAAMAYGLLAVGKKHVLVVDMGCGTLDCTAMHINEGTFRVLATAGTGASPLMDSGCGGRRIDQLVLTYVLHKFNIVVVDSSSSNNNDSSTTNTSVGKYFRPATAIDIKEPLRGKLLAICRLCKEAFSSLPPAVSSSSDIIGKGSGSWCGVRKGSTIPSDLGYDPDASVSIVFPWKLFADNLKNNNIDQNHDYLFIDDGFKTESAAHVDNDDGGSSAGAMPLAMVIAKAVNKGSLGQGQGLSCQLTAGEFFDLCEPVLQVVEGTVKHTVQQWRRQAIATTEKETTPSHGSISDGDVLMMDEVVLVGGSSRAIPVQRAVRKALLAEKALPSVSLPPISALATASMPIAQEQPDSVPLIPSPRLPLLSEHTISLDSESRRDVMFEFCSSVDCELAVVQGLAIRGAVLSGRKQTSSSRLKDLLMMDMLPTAIGLLVWSKSKSQGNDERFFEPVLYKGMRLPCTARHTFALATDDDSNGVRTRQRFVSLDVYEEIEEFVVSSDQESSSTSSSSLSYTYQIIGTYDFPTPPQDTTNHDRRHTADVVFSMSAEGELTISVEPTPPVTSSGSDPQAGIELAVAEPSAEIMRVLGIYLVLMVVLYLAAKTLLSN